MRVHFRIVRGPEGDGVGRAWTLGPAEMTRQISLGSAHAGPRSQARPTLSESTYVAAGPSRGRNVRLQHVVHHHAVRAEAPAERANGALNPRDPLARQAVAIA